MENDPQPLPPPGVNPEVRLRILGISLNQVRPGSYARVLIMAETDGPYRLPIVIGNAEAESIAIAIEGIKPPRPLTHDLFTHFADACGVLLRRVFIYRFEDGIYYSLLTFLDSQGKEISLDARTSDALALAARCNVPIYTTQDVIDEVGFIINPEDKAEKPAKGETEGGTRVMKVTVKDLEERLETLIQEENYEEASKVRDILKAAREAAADKENNE